MPDRWQEWFGTRKWRVATEADGEGSVTDSGNELRRVMFRQGRFTLEPPFAFTSPFGNNGRKGVLIREVRPDGTDIPGGELFAFGETAVKRAREEFHAIA